jgi:hypothetical protein
VGVTSWTEGAPRTAIHDGPASFGEQRALPKGATASPIDPNGPPSLDRPSCPTGRTSDPSRPSYALIAIDPGDGTSWDDVLVLARLYPRRPWITWVCGRR